MMRTEYLLIVLLLFLVLPFILTPGGGNRSPGMYEDPRHALFHGDSDVYDCIWQFSWIRRSLQEGTDPRVYGNITLAWHNMGWPDLFLSYLFRYGYGTSLLVATLFSAFSGYFLARAWGLGGKGALVAGFIAAWMPIRSIRMYQHYSIASAGYAIMALAMVKHILEKGRWKYSAGAFLFAGLAVAESFQHGFTIGLGWLLTVLLSKWRGLKSTALSASIPALGCVAGALFLLTSPGLTGNDPGKDWKEAVYWGAEIQSYFLPSFLGRHIVTDYMPNPFEGVVTPGLTVMLLAIWYAWAHRHWKALAAALAVMVLSMGPLFKLGGVPTPVPLPYMAVAKTPWLSAARTPARLGILVGLMAALGAGTMIGRRGKRTAWILTGLVLLEITPPFLRTIDTTVPSFYRSGHGAGLVLEIPASSAIRRYSLFEAADGVPRRVKFFARGGEDVLQGIPPGLTWDPDTIPSREDLLMTGADAVVYNRWMFPLNERILYDSLYAPIFTPEEREDSLWIWLSDENGS